MNKILIKIIFGASLCFCMPTSSTNKPFELWNKHEKPFFYGIFHRVDEALTTSYQELKPGKWVSQSIDNTKPIVVAISSQYQPKSGDLIDLYTLQPGAWKYSFLRISLLTKTIKNKCLEKLARQELIENTGYTFGPQEGPFLASFGINGHQWISPQNITLNSIHYTQAKHK